MHGTFAHDGAGALRHAGSAGVGGERGTAWPPRGFLHSVIGSALEGLASFQRWPVCASNATLA